jgi:hypothetical protein
MKSSIFWDIRPRSSVKVNRRFEGTFRPNLQCRGLSQARNQQLCLLFTLYWFLFDLEDGGHMFLRNVGLLSTDYTEL